MSLLCKQGKIQLDRKQGGSNLVLSIPSEPTITLGGALLGLVLKDFTKQRTRYKKYLKYLRDFSIIYPMRGLCHSCLTSNVELVVEKGKILCKDCHKKLKEK